MFCSILTGCGINMNKIEHGTVDAMYETKENKVTIYAFRFGEKCIETEHFYCIDMPLDKMTKDGAFYKIIADVTYLDGGVAGFMHYPDIRKVRECEEISSDELSFPSIEEEQFGLLTLGEYADADYLLKARGFAAVYKNGEWIYTYSTGMYIDNYQYVSCNEGVTAEEIYEGIEQGVLCCEAYFVMPSEE